MWLAATALGGDVGKLWERTYQIVAPGEALSHGSAIDARRLKLGGKAVGSIPALAGTFWKARTSEQRVRHQGSHFKPQCSQGNNRLIRCACAFKHLVPQRRTSQIKCAPLSKA